MSAPDSKRNSSEAWGDLSVFQQVMRQWADLHPYNAVHVFCFEGPADVQHLAESVEQAWRAFDFGIASVQGHRYRFTCPVAAPGTGSFFGPVCDAHLTRATAEKGACPPRPIPLRAIEIDVIPSGENPAQTLDAHLTALLNNPFPSRDYSPVHFSVVQTPASHWLCVSYDHWIGDGTALRTLLRPVIRRYCGDPGYETLDADGFRADVEKTSFYPPTYRTVYRRHFSAKAKRLFQWWRRMLANNATILAPSRGKASLYAEYVSRPLPDEALQNVSACAKRHGATVHDVFLAAITRAVMPYLPERLVRRKRRKMGIGSIVNARGAAEVDVDGAVGVYLGYFVTHSRSDQADTLAGLAQEIAKQTGVIKNDKAYLNTAIGMKIQCLLWPIIPRFARAAFLLNSVPLTAGITNSYIQDPWMLDLHESPSLRRLLAYFRAAPTGPVVPISFAPTTMAGALHLGITWRPSCFDRETIETIAARFENDLLAHDG